MVTDASTVPTLVSCEDRLMVVSCNARAGLPLSSCSCMNMQLYTLPSASTLVGPVKIESLVGLAIVSPFEFSKNTANPEVMIRAIKMKGTIFLNMFAHFFVSLMVSFA